MSVQKKSLISSRATQTSVSKPAEGKAAVGETKTLQAQALRLSALKKKKSYTLKSLKMDKG